MYPPNQTKMPVRPRSSLSMTTDDKHRIIYKNNKKPKAVLTLAGFCIFLLILCVFLLCALIYVGKNLKEGRTTPINQSLINFNDIFDNENDRIRLSTKPILSIRVDRNSSATTSPPLPSFRKTTKITAEMAASKILQQLTFRLPRELKPLHYKLKLHPDLKNKTFAGVVSIKVDIKQPISYIPVHSKYLTVKTDEVWQTNREGEQLRKVEPSLTFDHVDLEYWVTEFAEPLESGTYVMKLSFNGSLTNRIVGFYQSSYYDKKSDQSRWIATSKFEPTYARQAFPCFDEPAMKAQFDITVVRPKGDGYHALSNMDIEDETVVGDNVEVHFNQSVPMSTYLACFIVSDFAHQSATVHSGLEGVADFEMRVFATAAQINKVNYALDTGVKITEYYISYFNIPYPLPKLDMAAIPDFVSGAMEHWGLVTYRETALLYDETISSSANKQRVATVVAHELAHMWFGNLVTMKWWNDLWLNEGFASYIEYKGVNHVHPEWKMLDQFIVGNVHDVMDFDATLASHPIVQSVESPSQITELFDSITYSKGASVIRMLEDLVGEEKFRTATTDYLNKFYYGNAETEDFLTEVEAQEFDYDVKLIMQTWTKQMGLPVVEVTKQGDNVKLTQKRFFSNPQDYSNTYDSEFNYRWSIPITYFTNADPTVKRLIFNYNDQEASISLSGVSWVKFNKNQVGYYRVNYPVDMWNELINALNNNPIVFSTPDRAHLINDAFSLADASQLDYGVALDLSTYLEKELEYLPWRVASSRLKNIRNLLYYTDLYSDFSAYGRKIMDSVVETVGFTVDDNHLKNLLRANILSTACGFGHDWALNQAASRFTDWLSNPDVRPSPDIRSTVYYYGMQTNGNENAWNQVWKLFIEEQDAQEKIKLMESLAAIKEPWILQRYINLAWNESYVRRQDYFSCLQYIANNRIGESLVWEYVRENWPRLVERFGINERSLGRLIPAITNRFTTKTKLEEMEAFFAKYPEAGAGTVARKQAIETVKNNINWLEQNKDKVGSWLANQNTKLSKSKR